MDQQDTIALIERCEALRAGAKEMALAAGQPEAAAKAVGHAAARAAWNEWAHARLGELSALKRAGGWSAQRDGFGALEAKNDATRAWLEAAKADFSALRFVKRMKPNEVRLDLGEVTSRPPAWDTAEAVGIAEDEIDFTGFVFPGLADFTGAQFNIAAHFSEARFSSEARFRDVRFSRSSWFDQTRFSGEALFHGARFLGPTWFRGANFNLSADFEKAEFIREAWFDEAQFSDRARFGAALFSSEARFHKVEFTGGAAFNQTQFSSISWFDQAQFFAEAQFAEAHFTGKSLFREARFSGEAMFRAARFFVADFQHAQFHRTARFPGAQFSGETDFRATHFAGDCVFDTVKFGGSSDFKRAAFSERMSFTGSEFSGSALFNQCRFESDVCFSGARFAGPADFRLAVFSGSTSFEAAHFAGAAIFNAIRGGRAFDLHGVGFDCAPDFIQAHFDEAPRLDNIIVNEKIALSGNGANGTAFWRERPAQAVRGPLALVHRVFLADREAAARWRALKRLAAQARDHQHEQAFFAHEIRASRFASDKPIPWPLWRAEGWTRFARFWLGLLYGVFGNYGRSVFLPALWWMVSAALAAVVYLGAHDRVDERRTAYVAQGAHWSIAGLRSGYEAWRVAEPCVLPAASRTGLSALSPAVRDETNAVAEALELSLRTGLLIYDPQPDSARRILGCLYGLERFGETAIPVMPPIVSRVTLAQKVFSALMIFLFALAVRNMLRIG